MCRKRPRLWFIVLLGWILAASYAAARQPAPVVEVQPFDLEMRLAKIERLLQSRDLVELVTQIDSLKQEIKRLRGEIESQAHNLEKLNKRQQDLYVNVDRRLQALEAGRSTTATPLGSAEAPSPTIAEVNPSLAVLEQTEGDTTAVSPSQPQASASGPESSTVNAATPVQRASEVKSIGPAPTEGASTASTPSSTVVATAEPALEQEAYRRAFNLLKAGRYDQSIPAFNGFLAKYPNSSQADSAQYWLGEAYYVMRQYEPAIAEYTKLVQNYPQSQKLTHALLKIGYSYHELGQIDKAKASLEDLKRRYPGTTAARLAEERLQRITLEQP